MKGKCQFTEHASASYTVRVSSGHQVAENRDTYIIMVNITEGAATGKTAYAVSLDPNDANTIDLIDGDFGTCISTRAETDPW